MRGLRIIVFGYGKLGSRVAQSLSLHNEVWVYSRSTKPAYQGIRFIKGDVADAPFIEESLPNKLDVVLYCLSPSERSESAYRSVYVEGLENVLSSLQRCASKAHCIFVSSTSVYHQDDSSRVDEDSSTSPEGYSGRCMLEAESVLRHASVPGTSVRFSGIYGGTRSRLIDRVRQGGALKTEAVRLTNRIHEDDCVGFLMHLLKRIAQGQMVADCYIATDDCPVDLNAVIDFIASEYGVKAPAFGAAQARRAGNKRCNNQRMKDSGYLLSYPSYREGYRRVN